MTQRPHMRLHLRIHGREDIKNGSISSFKSFDRLVNPEDPLEMRKKTRKLRDLDM